MYEPGILISIIPISIRSTAPRTIATILVSPIVPAVLPIIMLYTLTLSPALREARGVAPEYASHVKSVIRLGKDINRKHLAASAGFIKFCPNPPNIILTTIMAKAPPMIPIQSGADTGRLSARRSPVTTADISPTVIFFFTISSNTSSEITHEAMVIST